MKKYYSIPFKDKFRISLPTLLIVNLPCLGIWRHIANNTLGSNYYLLVFVAVSSLINILFILWLLKHDWEIDENEIVKRLLLRKLRFGKEQVVKIGLGDPQIYGANGFELVTISLAIFSTKNELQYIEISNGEKISLYYDEGFVEELLPQLISSPTIATAQTH